MCYGPSLLSPQNQCEYSGYEVEQQKILGCSVYRGEYERIVSPCKKGAIMLEQLGPSRYKIIGLYVDEAYRRRDIARQLLAMCRHTYGLVYHNENLTQDGLAFSIACP